MTGHPAEETDALIRKATSGHSRAAADALIRIYYDPLFRLIYRKVGSREDALDLTQESFISMLKGISGFSGDSKNFEAWLATIAVRKVIDFRRKASLKTVPLEETLVDDKQDFVTELADSEIVLRFRSRVDAMDSETRDLVRMRVDEMRSFPEIAEITGQSETKLRTKYHRLVKRLRKEIIGDE